MMTTARAAVAKPAMTGGLCSHAAKRSRNATGAGSIRVSSSARAAGSVNNSRSGSSSDIAANNSSSVSAASNNAFRSASVSVPVA
jgi:hypothetical protein